MLNRTRARSDIDEINECNDNGMKIKNALYTVTFPRMDVPIGEKIIVVE